MTDEQAAADADSGQPDPPSMGDGGDRVDEPPESGASESAVGAEPSSLSVTDADERREHDAGAADAVPELGTVLVTGGAGFIGSHLVDALTAVNDVRVLDTFDTGSRERLPEEVVAIEGDVRDQPLLAEAAADADVIVHLAAQVSVEASLEAPRESSETNVSATLGVLECARQENARVVVASSAAIYGDPASVPVHETDPKRPESPYGVDKLAVDNYARVYGECFDVPVVVLRYFNVYGPGANAGVVQAFAERAAGGEPLRIQGDGEQTRDFVHVDDVVGATLAATEADATGRAYNVGTGERVTIAELAALVREHADGEVPIEHAPPRSGDIEHSAAAIDRLRSDLGYDPQVSLEDGLASTIAAVRAEQSVPQQS